MSKDWVKDMRDMASKYNIQEAVNNLDRNELGLFYIFVFIFYKKN